jgi:hypothetical protein
MTPDPEQGLKDLEAATAALVKMPLEDREGLEAVLARRSAAIARLAELKDAILAFPPEEQAQIVQRMRYASGGGELAQLRLAGSQRKSMAEWRQWNRISQSLPAGAPPDSKKVDWSG